MVLVAVGAFEQVSSAQATNGRRRCPWCGIARSPLDPPRRECSAGRQRRRVQRLANVIKQVESIDDRLQPCAHQQRHSGSP